MIGENDKTQTMKPCPTCGALSAVGAFQCQGCSRLFPSKEALEKQARIASAAAAPAVPDAFASENGVTIPGADPVSDAGVTRPQAIVIQQTSSKFLGRWTWWVVFFLIAWGFYVITPKGPPPNIAPSVGGVGVLNDGTFNGVMVGTSKEAYGDIEIAEMRYDKAKIMSIVSQGRAFIVPTGTQVRYLELDGLGVTAHFRIIGGAHDGQDVYCSPYCLKGH